MNEWLRDTEKQRGRVREDWRGAKTEAERMRSEVIKLNYYQSFFFLKMTKLEEKKTGAKREGKKWRVRMD